MNTAQQVQKWFQENRGEYTVASVALAELYFTMFIYPFMLKHEGLLNVELGMADKTDALPKLGMRVFYGHDNDSDKQFMATIWFTRVAK
jgi:hypothetical protein